MQVAAVHDEIAVLVAFLKALAQIDTGNFLSVDGVDKYERIWVEHLRLEHFHDAQPVEYGVAVGSYLNAIADFAHLRRPLKNFYGEPFSGQRQCCAQPANTPACNDER